MMDTDASDTFMARRRIAERFSDAKLDELYRAGMTCKQIAELVSELNGRFVCYTTVWKWMREAGIPLRDGATAARLRSKRRLAELRLAAKKGGDRAAEINLGSKQTGERLMKTRRAARLGLKVLCQKRKAERPIVACAYRECRAPLSLKPSEINPRGNYCNSRCFGKENILRRMEDKRNASLEQPIIIQLPPPPLASKMPDLWAEIQRVKARRADTGDSQPEP